MRALFITRKWPPAVGGMETYSREMAAELGRHVDLTIRALPGRSNGGAPSGGALVLFGLRMVWFLLRHRGSFDVIHAADLAIWPLAWFGGLVNRRAVTVASAHGTDAAYPVRPGILPWSYGRYLWLGVVLAGGLRVIANSEATAALCRKIGFRHVAVAPLGVRNISTSDIEATERFVLFVGRLVARKGCGWFIREVLPMLSPDISLRIAGTVWDDSERRLLDTERVDFLGPVFGEDLARLRRRAIAVVMPNLKLHKGDFVEGFGLAALETAADGGVVCASRLDGLIDAVRDGETGFLMPAGEAAAWANRIMELSQWSLADRSAYAARARSIVEKEFSWERTAAKTLAVYGLSVTEHRTEP